MAEWLMMMATPLAEFSTSAKQLEALIEKMDDAGVDKVRFCKFFKIEGVARLPLARLPQAIGMIEAKKKARS